MAKKKSKEQLEALKGLAQREVIKDETINARAQDPRFLEMLERIKDGQSIRGACGLSKFSKATLYRWMDKHPEIKELVEEALDEGFGTIELNLMRSASQSDDKDWRALSWMLARRFPAEYGEKKELEISAKKQDGIPEVIAMIEQTNAMMVDEPKDE